MSQPSQADIFAALQAQSFGSRSKPRPPTTTLSDHTDPQSSLTTSREGEGEGSKATGNATKIYCWREGCGCVVLSTGVGEWVLADPDLIPAEPGSPFPESQLVNEKQAAYWHVTGSPMAFDNVGFSKPSLEKTLPANAPGMAEGQKVKWLICADCDLGPIGWSFEGGTEAWLAADRVRYGKSA